jgi:hypothetical protein
MGSDKYQSYDYLIHLLIVYSNSMPYRKSLCLRNALNLDHRTISWGNCLEARS